MKFLHFYKYQATGNDFILIDNRSKEYSFSKHRIIQICHRRWGIGADGLIVIEPHPDADFSMMYYNSDGTQSLCGNGCRAAVDLAARLKMIEDKASFTAFDGLHQASVLTNNRICLAMNDVSEIKNRQDDWLIDTGSPHYVKFVTQLDNYNVVEEGRKIRYSEALQPQGANINFVELLPNNAIAMRTYERGVEAETLSCGTGAVAAALASSLQGYRSPVIVQVQGGQLAVSFEPLPAGAFSRIFLTGPAEMVFEGDIVV